MKAPSRECLAAAVAAATFLREIAGENKAAVQDLTRLSLKDLMNIEVTSVAKKEQTLADSAAAVEDGTQATFIEPSFDVRATWRR